jgi:uncharacterized protein (TIGR02145 family)
MEKNVMNVTITDAKTGGKLVNERISVYDEKELENTKEIIDEIYKECEKLKERATGRTTRLVDEYIQKLFNNIGGWVEIRDHHDSFDSHKRLCDLINRRIGIEHPQFETKYSHYIPVFGNNGNKVVTHHLKLVDKRIHIITTPKGSTFCKSMYELYKKSKNTITLIGLEWDKENIDGYYTFEKANKIAEDNGKRLPTVKEFEKLSKLPHVWDEGKGIWFAENKNDLNNPDKSLFLPAMGYRSTNGAVSDQGVYGSYWSSTSDSTENAYGQYFCNYYINAQGIFDNQFGFTVRCVNK